MISIYLLLDSSFPLLDIIRSSLDTYHGVSMPVNTRNGPYGKYGLGVLATYIIRYEGCVQYKIRTHHGASGYPSVVCSFVSGCQRQTGIIYISSI